MGSLGIDIIEENLAAVLHGKDDLRMDKVPVPEPNDDQVLLRMSAVGICGSDVHYWTHGRIDHYVITDPLTLGHEAAGVVVRCGKNVKNLKPGDRVAIEPGVPCRMCDLCKRGEYNICKDVAFCGTPPVNGSLSKYYCHVADFCHKLPDHVSMEEGSLMEPIACGVHACRRAGVSLGSKVLITGAGPIGLVNLLVAKAMGADKVILTDVNEHRLKIAKSLGADYTLAVEKSKTEEDLALEIEKLLGAMPDSSIDCCGQESTISLCMLATRSGGTMCVIGFSPPKVTVPFIRALFREVTIKGMFRYANCYPAALSMVATGKVDAKKLITHNFKIEESLEAFEIAKTGAGGAIKVMIHC